MEWIAGNGKTLCLSGYEGRPPLLYFALASAKLDGERTAREMDEFAG